MATVSFNSLPPATARYLLENQRQYSPGQRRMAIDSPHLMWVNAKSRALPKALRAQVYERDRGVCAYCDKHLSFKSFTVDHIEPVAKGGGDEIENLTVACRPCNSRKGARTWES